MPNPVKDVTFTEAEPESLEDLRGLGARMAPHWAPGAPQVPGAVPPSRIRGVSVPAGSARLLESMSEYGD
ncbi:hypothetical protein ABZ951_33690 [Streptomyces sp. NPDC046215]